MSLPYSYQSTPQINQLLIDIEARYQASHLLPPPPPAILQNLRAVSTLHSAVYSARIEGNPLSISEFTHSPASRHKQEILNLHQALEWIYRQPRQLTLTQSIIKQLHHTCLYQCGSDPGTFRTEQSAIFNQAGVAIYLTPPPSTIKLELTRILRFIRSSSLPIPIKAAIAHYAFEKLHPFIDGNGRVGRLLTLIILRSRGYDFMGLLNLDRYFARHRQTYYDTLTLTRPDITSFIEFFLTAISRQSQLALDQLRVKPSSRPEDRLLPRRREILHIIRDHQLVSFDFIHRRFTQTPKSTLHYDLNQLILGKFISKVGSTRGALYSPASS